MGQIHLIVWFVTIGVLLAIITFDAVIIARRKGLVTVGLALRWLSLYVSLASIFAGALFLTLGATPAGQFAASYITEYSLSVDNLFVFMMIVSRFAVPTVALDRALYLGIWLSLVLRGIFIAGGALVINTFSWVFYIFGVFLMWTAARLLFVGNDDAQQAPVDPMVKDSPLLRVLRRILPTTTEYDGVHFATRAGGRRQFTPLVLVVAAIGLANLVFALDSIPAVFGLTHSGYIVFTANAFAMMGLRQLYFLIQGLLPKITYLDTGLAVILGFIAVKLIFEALRGSHLVKIAGVPVPVVGTGLSLAVIVGVLATVAIVSLAVDRRRTRASRRHTGRCPVD